MSGNNSTHEKRQNQTQNCSVGSSVTQCILQVHVCILISMFWNAAGLDSACPLFYNWIATHFKTNVVVLKLADKIN